MQSDIYNNAIRAYKSGDDDSAKKMIDAAIEYAPESEDGLSLRFIRARAYEFGGYPGGIDSGKAYEDYKFLEEWTSLFESNALVGAARTLFDLDGNSNEIEIRRLCFRAIKIDNSVYAKMILGLLYDKVIKNNKSARRWYLSAYISGMPWGLRYFANSHAKSGNGLRAMAAHLVTSITSPFLVLFFGARGPFCEHP